MGRVAPGVVAGVSRGLPEAMRRAVLITGAGGLVGSTLCRRVPEGVTVEGTVRSRPAPDGTRSHRIDLAQPGAFLDLVARRRPSLVIHTAYDPRDHQHGIVDATIEVASACAALEIPLIHFSTDAVFDGEHAPYGEDDVPEPVHAYGRAKRLAEVAVGDSGGDVAIVRTSIVVSDVPLDGTSEWVVTALRAGERVTLFGDEIRTPILVDDLADATWEIASLEPAARSGIWHLRGPEALSRVDIGMWLCRRFDLDPSLIDVRSSAVEGAGRPRDLSLTGARAATLSVRPRPLSTVTGHGQTHR